MSSKKIILNSISSLNIVKDPGLPDYKEFTPMSFENLYDSYKSALVSVGGSVEELRDGEDLATLVKRVFPEAKTIASTVDIYDEATVNLNDVKDPHKFSNVDLTLIQGEFAIAENGAVWVKHENVTLPALYFLATNILIVVPKDEIVATMHEAFKRVSLSEQNFGLFISGPSKTADIEQSLVIGAHGPKSGVVVFV
ncbi:MAG: lactate utilization protein [Sulfurospirillaceae bacterium]|jgi:L-lactate dehydrogenase complex protein LldG|nr:lactate utilization protein [Sulfurospirillaceae bacterium]MCK9546220.1 lactate utilization protein [Sulfurospirillaceae bacterium]MDY0237820.1 LUD domain-containing protein [Campylobacterales bacterium]NLM98592.1 LUD domain-containing protein [Campylobacteraceae bacterium]